MKGGGVQIGQAGEKWEGVMQVSGGSLGGWKKEERK